MDEIGDVVEIQDDTYERPPETLKGVARELVRGVYKLKDRLLLILDTERTVSLPGGFNHAQQSELKYRRHVAQSNISRMHGMPENLPHFIGQIMGMAGLPAPEKSIPGFKLPIQTNCHTT